MALSLMLGYTGMFGDDEWIRESCTICLAWLRFYGLRRYLKPECDGLGCPHAHSLADGAEDDGGKGMCCRGKFGLVASTAACWSRNQDILFAHGHSFALKPGGRLTSECTPTQPAAEPGKAEATALSKSDPSPPFNSAPRWCFGGVALVSPPLSSLFDVSQVCIAQPG